VNWGIWSMQDTSSSKRRNSGKKAGACITHLTIPRRILLMLWIG